jgi:hypothetical protein
MTTYWNEEYQQAKRIKRTGALLESPFKELAEWIAAEYGVRVLNLLYDVVAPNDVPRLRVTLEMEEEALRFQHGPWGVNREEDQKRVQEGFLSILKRQGDPRYTAEGLFVVFDSFERVARFEANESVTADDLKRLKAKLDDPDLWEISRLFDRVTFFFYTDAQARQHEAAGLRDSYAREYARLVEPYDEFSYLRRRAVSAYFDSKENFDTNYEGNWYYYYK